MNYDMNYDTPIFLCEKLRNWISQINLKFTYNNCFTVDLLDYFPLLKKGMCSFTTLDFIIFTCSKLNIIDKDKFYPSEYIKYSMPIGSIPYKLDQEIHIEKLHSMELYTCFDYTSIHIDMYILEDGYYNQLCQLLMSFKHTHKGLGTNYFNENGKHQSLFCKLLLNDYIKLMCTILSCDECNMNLYIENIDLRCHNNVLYKLSVDQDLDALKLMFYHKLQKEASLNISNIIKTAIIKRNLIEQQVLIDNFEELLLIQTDIPNNIFNYMNNLIY